MPWPSNRKHDTRQRILDIAADLFARQGYDNVSLDALMGHADLTRGAFYAHFDSKQALYAEAVTYAARRSARDGLRHVGDPGTAALAELLRAYLDPAHAAGQRSPCPLAFLATDVANREGEVRSAYTRVFRQLGGMIKRALPARSRDREERALALAAMMVGGVAIGRALNDSRLTDTLLRACRHVGTDLIETAGPGRRR
ncbi:MAG: TetR/AcrR family transcriptional regulator [Gammaproteobacteria bacterium]|nr:TetR/AcrR family transcriptional regulator [Gammaproteobacteria bacterium]